MNAARLVQGSELLVLPTTTMLGALLNSITDPNRKNFQPSNVNMGLLPPDDFAGKKDKKAKYARYALRSQQDLHSWMLGNHLGGL